MTSPLPLQSTQEPSEEWRRQLEIYCSRQGAGEVLAQKSGSKQRTWGSTQEEICPDSLLGKRLEEGASTSQAPSQAHMGGDRVFRQEEPNL